MAEGRKIKIRYLLYEFIGTLLICVAYNLTKSYDTMLLVCLIFAWNHSAGHFNSALTFGEIFFKSEDLKEFVKGILPMIGVIIAQVCGALGGWGCSAMIVRTYYDIH